MRVVILRGRVSFWIIVCQGECCFFFRDVVRILCIFSFLSFLDTLFLYMRSCDHLQTYIVLIFSSILLMYVSLSPTLSCVVSFLSLYTCFLLFDAIYYFCFTQRCLNEFCLKVFQKYRLSKSTCHKLSSCKVFQEFVLGQILLYSTSEYELSDL